MATARPNNDHRPSCKKETIIPILLGHPTLLIPDAEAYKSWILVGLDLGIPTEQLQQIKKLAKRTELLHGVVAELIEEWLRELARKGRNASVWDLVWALGRNHLKGFGEAIESKLPELPSSTTPPSAVEVSSSGLKLRDYAGRGRGRSDEDNSSVNAESTDLDFQGGTKESVSTTARGRLLPLPVPPPSSSVSSISTVALPLPLSDKRKANKEDVSPAGDADTSRKAGASSGSSSGARRRFRESSPASCSSWSSSFSHESVDYANDSDDKNKGDDNDVIDNNKIPKGNSSATIIAEKTKAKWIPLTSTEELYDPFAPLSDNDDLDIAPARASTSQKQTRSTAAQGRRLQKDREGKSLVERELDKLQRAIGDLQKVEERSSSQRRGNERESYSSSRDKRKYDDDDDDRGSDKSNKRFCRRRHSSSSSSSSDSGSDSELAKKRKTYIQNNREGLNSLHLAVLENRISSVKKLLGDGVEVNEPTNDMYRTTALHLASAYIENRDDAIEMITRLIASGADMEKTDARGRLFIYILLKDLHSQQQQKIEAINCSQFHKLVNILIILGKGQFLVKPRDDNYSDGASILQLAMMNGILGRDTLELLYEKNVSLTLPCTNGNTLLFYAIRGKRSVAMIKYLIVDCGVNWQTVNKNGWSLLHVAAKVCHVDAFEYFLSLENCKSFLSHKSVAKPIQTPVDIVKRFWGRNQRLKKILEKEGVKVDW